MKDLYHLFRHSVAGLTVLLASTVVLGIAYPLVVTGVAAVAMPSGPGLLRRRRG